MCFPAERRPDAPNYPDSLIISLKLVHVKSPSRLIQNARMEAMSSHPINGLIGTFRVPGGGLFADRSVTNDQDEPLG